MTDSTYAPRRSIDSRVPPHNIAAEQSLLGALLLSREAIDQVSELGLEAEHFYKPAHQHLFRAIRGLVTHGEPADVVTVGDELRREGLLDEVGGSIALLELQNTTPAVSNARRYAKIVQDTAILRRIISVGGELAELGYSAPEDVSSVLDDAERRVYEIGGKRLASSTVAVNDLLPSFIDHVQQIADGDLPTGTPTGFDDLDRLLSGLQPSTLNIIGARPGMGKTALGLGIATHVARTQRKPVIVFSLEMGHAELTQRILSSEAEVDSTKLRSGDLSEADWSRIGRAINRLEIPLLLDDDARVTVMEIRAKARRISSESGGLALIVIDYLQLMSGGGRSENRQLEVSEISRGLKVLARELKVPIIALSQLSRNLESRADKRPMLADLRESGSLEQDADVVMFLYRDDQYNRDSPDRAAAEVLVAKHRAGPTGMVKLVYRSQYTKFANAAHGM